MLEPEFPPLLTGRRVIEGQSVLAAAIAGASVGSLGAGDLLWDDDPARVELAIVLEPEVLAGKGCPDVAGGDGCCRRLYWGAIPTAGRRNVPLAGRNPG